MRSKPRAGWAFFYVVSTIGMAACAGGFNLPIDPDDSGADATAASDVAIVTETSMAEASEDAADGAAADSPLEAGDPRCELCPYGDPMPLGSIPSKIPELSGLAASIKFPGILYAHNDSGDSARLFALNQSAALEAELDLVGAVATDWEDIEMGPCASGSCVYVGDIGDNDSKRTEYAIYRVPEPDSLPMDGSSMSVAYERFPFVYPDGPHNSESLLIHPATGRIFVVTKISGVQGTVYEMPLPPKPDQKVTMVKVMDVSLPALAGVITGGSFHPCSNRLLLRTYFALYELSNLVDSRPEALFAADPVQVPVAMEVKGEAVTYAVNGRGYYTASETPSNSPPSQLSFVTCP